MTALLFHYFWNFDYISLTLGKKYCHHSFIITFLSVHNGVLKKQDVFFAMESASKSTHECYRNFFGQERIGRLHHIGQVSHQHLLFKNMPLGSVVKQSCFDLTVMLAAILYAIFVSGTAMNSTVNQLTHFTLHLLSYLPNMTQESTDNTIDTKMTYIKHM